MADGSNQAKCLLLLSGVAFADASDVAVGVTVVLVTWQDTWQKRIHIHTHAGIVGDKGARQTQELK